MVKEKQEIQSVLFGGAFVIAFVVEMPKSKLLKKLLVRQLPPRAQSALDVFCRLAFPIILLSRLVSSSLKCSKNERKSCLG